MFNCLRNRISSPENRKSLTSDEFYPFEAPTDANENESTVDEAKTEQVSKVCTINLSQSLFSKLMIDSYDSYNIAILNINYDNISWQFWTFLFLAQAEGWQKKKVKRKPEAERRQRIK